MSKKSLGFGSLLVAVYGVFALSSSARASYQLIREFEQAPFAYILSSVSAAVYVLATIALAKSGGPWRRIANLTVVFELVGVVTVGSLSYLLPELFAHPSVWSNFGAGYGYVPLVLPVLGLIWLRRRSVTDN